MDTDKCEEFCLGSDVPVVCDQISDCRKIRCLEACRDCDGPNGTICHCPYINYNGTLEKQVFTQFNFEAELKRSVFVGILVYIVYVFFALLFFFIYRWTIKSRRAHRRVAVISTPEPAPEVAPKTPPPPPTGQQISFALKRDDETLEENSNNQNQNYDNTNINGEARTISRESGHIV